MRDVTAVIPAGGLGTRLSSVIAGGPKSLAPVAGKPFLHWQLRCLQRLGATRAHLCLGHGAADIRAALGSCRPAGLTVTHSVESRPLGVIGAVRLALDTLPARFLLLYGDVLPAPALDRLWEAHLRNRPGATMLVTKAAGESNIELAGDVVTRYDKSGSGDRPFVDIGMTVVEASTLAALPPHRRVDEPAFLGDLVARRELRALRWPYGTQHIGDPRAHARCTEFVRTRLCAMSGGTGEGELP